MVNLTINKKAIHVNEDCTILEAAKKYGMIIPTLCYLKGVHACGSCRICSVEVEGSDNLVAACVTKVREGMVVHTNSNKVISARQMIYRLFLSDHSRQCLSCTRNQSCELQNLGGSLGVYDMLFETQSSRETVDTSVSIERDLSKCILCRRCISVCKDIQGVGVLAAQHRGFDTQIGPQMDISLEHSHCTYCGQCLVVCPVGALKTVNPAKKVAGALGDPNVRVVMQCAPSVRVAIAEMFGNPEGSCETGKLVAAMRAMGADDVFDTNWGADLTVVEEGNEFLNRLRDMVEEKKPSLPMITSCSPGWVKFMEHFYPMHIDNLSTCKSPHMMLGAIAKTYYASKIGVDAEEMFVLSVMPCSAKKYEISREEMKNDETANVDAVLTTREFSYMLRQMGIDFNRLENEEFDAPMGDCSGAAELFGVTGGVMEAALRTVYARVTGKEMPDIEFKMSETFEGVKEGSLTLNGLEERFTALEGFEVKVAVVSGLLGARKLMDKLSSLPYHFIEIMGCPDGCIMGGGQPRSKEEDVAIKRRRALLNEGATKSVRSSHKNPSIVRLYEEFLGEPGSQLAHELLHTTYIRRGLQGDWAAADEDAQG